ncbi:protein GVQW3-like [Halictus rubicundus]|uniref:protein GVQW3-like n=1 Tax=Halictus rubicundus TaxID=77578 RepID=UPI004036B251
MATLLTDPRDFRVVLTFKQYVSKFHGILTTMDRKEFRVSIKHCFLMGKNTVGAKQWLDKHYGGSAPGKSTIIDWYAEFKRGRTSTDDAERSGRRKSAVVPENIKNVHKIVLKDRKMKLREIADTLKISEGSVFTILHENLGMRKLLSKWVPRLLTPDQKQQRVDDSERCFELFKRNKKDFLRRYVTMDETWIHLYTPERNLAQMKKRLPKLRLILRAKTNRFT